MRRKLFLPLIVVMLAVSVGCIHIYEPRAAAGPGGPPDGKKDGKEKEPFKPWDKVTKGSEEIKGFFTWHLKRDNKLLLELPADRIGQEFGTVLHISRGAGVFDLHDGLELTGTELMRFRRVGDTVYLVHVNPRFIASGDAGMKRAVKDNTGHSILAAFNILSEHKKTKNILVDVTEFFVSDHAGVSDRLKFYYANKPVSLDKKRSFISKLQAFPKNDELDVEITFKAGSPPIFGGEGIPDHRAVPLGIRYSMFALPEDPMMPRLADDRVGHYLTAVKDFSKDQEPEWYRRYVWRWRLEKKDPGAALSEPVKPIVFYVDTSVPEPYRQYVKEGLEAWNKAFEAAGFKNAIVAKDPPQDDPTWNAEDIRYSTVKWSAAHRMGYAIGPSQADPRTGEILNADILISSTWIRGWLNDYQVLGPQAMMGTLHQGDPRWQHLPQHMRERICVAEMGKAHQLGVQYALLAGMGALEPGQPMPPEFLRTAIMELILHEVGHTLGLQHNFKASSATPMGKIHQASYTREHGVGASVMDYNPVNISPDPAKQGDYWTSAPGDYDRWAIQYAYMPVYKPGTGEPVDSPDEELPELEKIAGRASEPLLAYNTDEDNWLGPFAVDPYTNAWDLGADPVQFAKERASIVRRVMPELEKRLVADGQGYQRLRNAFGRLFFEGTYPLFTATKMVGGMRFARDHKGDPGGRLPFTPVPAEKQREAVQVIVDGAFSEDSFRFDPELLNKLAPNRFYHWGMPLSRQVEYPTHRVVEGWQRRILGSLLAPARLNRMVESEIRYGDGAGPYSMSEMFGTLTAAAWSELGGGGASPKSISSFRRNLQRAYVDLFADVLLGVGDGPAAPMPDDACALARYHLTALSDRIDSVIDSPGLDTQTQAHLEETRARIDRILDASVTLNAVGARP
jgi:hypothetical protein